MKDFLQANHFRVFWLAIANFIKKSGYNTYNEDFSERHNVSLIGYNEDLHYKKSNIRYMQIISL